MTDGNDVRRRRFLKASGVAGVTALAGCTGGIGGGGGGGPIPVGSIMPVTGQLSAFGEGMQTAVELAVEDINAAGGILGGRELDLSTADSQTQPSQGVQEYNNLVSENDIVGFVGAASSGVSTSIAENVADDQVMQVSHASTSPVLADVGYTEVDGTELKFFGRTAPNDGQQGAVMGRIMGSGDYISADSASLLFVDNAYGEGLANVAAENFDGEVLNQVGYSAQTQDYTSTLDALHEGDPDAIGFVGYPENGQTILDQWSDGGYNTSAEDWVLSEGLNSEEFLADNSDILSGMYVSSPASLDSPGADRFREKSDAANTLFGPHAYDAMALMALAMQRAEEASGPAIAGNIRAVSRGDGTEVTVGELETAIGELESGNEVNYEGASSPVDLNPALEPVNPMAVLRIRDDGSTEELERIPVSEFQ